MSIELKRLIRRQAASATLLAAFPEAQHQQRIKDFLFAQHGDKFSPRLGEVVAAWNGNPQVVTFGRFEGGGNGVNRVGGRVFQNVRELNEGES